MKVKTIISLIILAWLPGGSQPHSLTCEYLTNPLGIDVTEPRLSWVVPLTERGEIQTAYQITVSSSPGGDGDLWNSGKVMSDKSIHVKYRGVPLTSGMRCYWKVETFGKNASHGVSEEATWTMGLLEKSDWKGEWIFGENSKRHLWFRKKFTLNDSATSAFAYVASRGWHELYINGQKADDRVLAPTLTNYHKRTHYVTYDITQYLTAGENVISVWYGPGWTMYGSFRPPQYILIAQININTTGAPVSVSTDAGWKWFPSSSEHTGGWKWNDMGGEKFDARNHISKWNTVAYDDAGWNSANTASYSSTLSAEMVEPDRIIDTIAVTGITNNGSTYYVSLEKNFTGWVEASLKGASGTTATIKIKDDVTGGDYGEFGQTSSYVFDNSGQGVFRNRFNYMAGIKLEIANITAEPVVKAYAISNDLKRVGSFTSSNDLFNDIYETDLWTYRANTLNGLTMDCPHRERNGYGEVAFATSWGIGLPNYEAGGFYTKFIRDWRDVQRSDGRLYFVAPTTNVTWGGPLWSSAPVTLTWELYRSYGDLDIVHNSYQSMKRWLDFLNSQISGGLLGAYDGGNRFLGEWSAPNDRKEAGNTPEAVLFNNCVYAMIMQMFVSMAGAVNNPGDVSQYSDRLNELRANIHNHFFNSADNNYIDNAQLHLAFPLYTRVTPPDKREAVLANFEKEILTTTPYLDMGSSGLPILLHYLIEDAQRHDIIYEHLKKTNHPSYGYFLSRGETTWPEYWSSTRDSKIHTCYTGIASYFLKGLLGIQPDSAIPGFKHFIVKPAMAGDLTFAEGSHHSMYGTITSGWKMEPDGAFRLTAAVPANTTADIYVPKIEYNTTDWAVQESQGLCWQNGAWVPNTPGITLGREESEYIVFQTGSGEYNFHAGPNTAVSVVPPKFSLTLGHNFPNPFTSATTIRYSVSGKGEAQVTLNIFTTRGSLVRELVNHPVKPGSYAAKWDGRDVRGFAVPSGTYIYRLKAGENAGMNMKMLKL